MLRVGLTGGVGSGKSAVARLLAEHGAVVIDADVLAREVVAPGTEGLTEVVAAFGPDLLTADGSLDRRALGERVFADEEARRRLEAIVHPRVRARATEIEATMPVDAVVVHDIPLLVETGRAEDFDVVLVVDAPDDVRIRRLAEARGLSVEESRDRMRAQASRTIRNSAADIVIDNAGDPADLRARVATVWKVLCERSHPV